MKKRDLISSLVWSGVGIIFCIGALKYRLFKENIPGAGFLPFIVGIFLIGLSAVVLFWSMKADKEDQENMGRENFFPEKDSLKKVLLSVSALFAYLILLNYLGFLLTTFLFLIVLLRFIEPQGWVTTFTAAFLTTISSYALFKLWLQVQLPKGIMGL